MSSGLSALNRLKITMASSQLQWGQSLETGLTCKSTLGILGRLGLVRISKFV